MYVVASRKEIHERKAAESGTTGGKKQATRPYAVDRYSRDSTRHSEQTTNPNPKPHTTYHKTEPNTTTTANQHCHLRPPPLIAILPHTITHIRSCLLQHLRQPQTIHPLPSPTHPLRWGRSPCSVQLRPAVVVSYTEGP